MEESYDILILGTGLTECILSGLLSTNGKKVLHIDRNNYYGGNTSSLTFEQCWKYFKEEDEIPDKFGDIKKYSIDLLPKFLMADGEMVKLLIKTDVTRYLEFKSIDGSYTLKDQKIMKVPANEKEAISTSLMGFFEKRNFKNYLEFCNNNKEFKGNTSKLLKQYNLDFSTENIIGYSICLYTSSDWRENLANETIMRTKLYIDSLNKYGKSPYLYPLYGLGDLPQSFARLSAVNGGTYMLNKSDDEINFLIENHKGKHIIGDPSYFQDKIKKVGEVIRCINILDHPLNSSNSCQIVIPHTELNRKNNVYISCLSNDHQIAPKGYYVVIISTKIETDNSREELKFALNLLGKIIHQFWSIEPMYIPSNDNKNIHISSSYDESSHFESVTKDVMKIYKEII